MLEKIEETRKEKNPLKKEKLIAIAENQR